MLKEYKFRFYDSSIHKEGVLTIISALYSAQAHSFADQISASLKTYYGWDVDSLRYEMLD